MPRRLAGTPTLFQQAMAAALPAGEDGQRQADEQGEAQHGAAQQGMAQHGEVQQAQQLELGADLIWLACGRAYDASADPVLRQLQALRPTLLAGGYPAVDAEHMCWPGAAVYLAGRAALLAAGPCAGRHRTGAARAGKLWRGGGWEVQGGDM